MIRIAGLGAALAALVLGTGQAKSEVIDGQWVFHYPCDGTSGMYADRCKAGEGDIFQLFLRKTGNKVCGSYALTTHGTNHVDEGDVKDWTFEEAESPATYRVSFHFDGTSGEALVRINHAEISWEVVKEARVAVEDPALVAFSPPRHAILIKQRSDKEWPPCDTK